MFKIFMIEIDDINLGIKIFVETVDGNIAYECGISEFRRRFIVNVCCMFCLYLMLFYINEDMGIFVVVVFYIMDYFKIVMKMCLLIIANL